MFNFLSGRAAVPSGVTKGFLEYEFPKYEAIDQVVISEASVIIGGLRFVIAAVPVDGDVVGQRDSLSFHLIPHLNQDDGSPWTADVEANYIINSVSRYHFHVTKHVMGECSRGIMLDGTPSVRKTSRDDQRLYSNNGGIKIGVEITVGELKNLYNPLQLRMKAMLDNHALADLILVHRDGDVSTPFHCHIFMISSESPILKAAIQEAKLFQMENLDDLVTDEEFIAFKIEIEVALSKEALQGWLEYIYMDDDHLIRQSMPLAFELHTFSVQHGMTKLKDRCSFAISNLVSTDSTAIEIRQALNLYRVAMDTENGLGDEATKNVERAALRSLKNEDIKNPVLIEFLQVHGELGVDLIQKLTNLQLN